MRQLEEHVVSFQEFHKKYIASGVVKLLKLPLMLPQEDESALSTRDSPEGAFQNIPKKNYNVFVIGLLPDTSRYYGIVYDFQMDDYITNAETGVYSTRIATFTKDGKLINRAPVIQVGNFTGASSCGYADNDIMGYIDSDLSFFGIHIMTQDCTVEGSVCPAQSSTTTFGNLNADGTLLSKTTENQTGDEEYTRLVEELKNGTLKPEVSETIQRITMFAVPTPEDLTYFFTPSELTQSSPYSWYALHYPAGKNQLTAVVRRIKSDNEVRRRQYSFALVKNDRIGAPFNFNWTNGQTTESSEPPVSIVADHFILIMTEDSAGPTGKYVEEHYYIAVISGDDLVSLNSLSKDELRLQRNWIYAKHGMKFKTPELTSYFSTFDWYKPTVSTVADGDLNYEEREIINTIQGLERQ